MANPQKENGYTKIANEIIENLVQQDLLGSEFRILVFLIRKTYGFNKKEDRVSLTQFQEGTKLTRPTVIKSLKNLIARNIVVKTALPAYGVNKDWESWVVNDALLVKHAFKNGKTGFTKTSKARFTHKRKKETNKRNTAARTDKKTSNLSPLGADVLKAFESVDPKNKTYYNRKPQREACEFLIAEYGFDQVIKTIRLLPKTNKIPYFPKITSPYDLKEKWVKLVDSFHQKKQEITSKGRGFAE